MDSNRRDWLWLALLIAINSIFFYACGWFTATMGMGLPYGGAW